MFLRPGKRRGKPVPPVGSDGGEGDRLAAGPTSHPGARGQQAMEGPAHPRGHPQSPFWPVRPAERGPQDTPRRGIQGSWAGTEAGVGRGSQQTPASGLLCPGCEAPARTRGWLRRRQAGGQSTEGSPAVRKRLLGGGQASGEAG